MKHSLLTLLCLVSVHALIAQPTIYTAGMARGVMTGTDLSDHILVDTINTLPHLYALGPVSDLQGEITVLDGVPFVSVAFDQVISAGKADHLKAPFMVYTYAGNWSMHEHSGDIHSMKELESAVAQAARSKGLDPEKPFVFKLSGTFELVEFHVIMRDLSEKEHNHELHNKSKVHFTEKSVSGTLLGFYSTQHEGVFTHKGQYIHVHFVDENNRTTGHLDGIILKNAVIQLGE